MESSDILEKWVAESLTYDDIHNYLLDNHEAGQWDLHYGVDKDDLSHVASGCLSIYQAEKKGIPPGGFIKAVMNNDLRAATARADFTNKSLLWVYTIFLDNCVPINSSGSGENV